MKRVYLLRRIGIIVLMLGMASAEAQPGSSDAQPSASEVARPDAKAIRAANRQLEKAVRRAFVKVKGLDSTNIVVVSRQGMVTLNGSVPEASQVELAVTTARNVHGVVAVNNRLSVRPPGL